jgi:hypothetical protein
MPEKRQKKTPLIGKSIALTTSRFPSLYAIIITHPLLDVDSNDK